MRPRITSGNCSQSPEQKMFENKVPKVENGTCEEESSNPTDQELLKLEESPLARKNKRKSQVPQRAHKSDVCKQLIKHEIKVEMVESEDESDTDEIIVKLQEEHGNCENLNEDMLNNVKEEWRSKNKIKCNMCKMIFHYKSEFDSHYKETYNQTPVYTCLFCNKTMENYATFRSHCYRHITESRFKCAECPKGFALQSLLQVHISAKHTKVKPFQCDQCGKNFITKAGMRIHVKKHKSSGVQEDYPCIECGKILHSRGGLTSHMNGHRLGRRFMCDFCGKTFTQKVNMLQHVKQHTGDKPYECDKCGKTFAEKSHLARHHSFHSETRPYKCEICAKMYKTERCLKVHSMVHAKERPYICTTCNKGFLSNTKLKQHYNIHTGERPYACKYCERKFTNYPNWLKHTRRRHNVDHKTGETLENKSNKPIEGGRRNVKMEDLNTDSVQSDFFTNLGADSVDSLDDNLTSDITLSKTEELFLKQSIKDFPCTLKFLDPNAMHPVEDSSEIVFEDFNTAANHFYIPDGQSDIGANSLVQSVSQFDYVPLQFS